MSSGHSDHVYDSVTSTNHHQSAPMSETAPARPGSIGAMPLVSSTPDNKRKIEKQSLEYAIRSGVAGGLAGCAVSVRRRIPSDLHTDRNLLGQNSRRTARPRKDPFPSVESPVRQIHRQLDGACPCNPRHQSQRRRQRPIQGPLRDPPPHIPLRRH